MKLQIPVLIAAMLLGIAEGVRSEEPLQPSDVDLCTLLENPIPYHGKLISLEGLVSRGHEDFTLWGQACPDRHPLWIAYGDTKRTEDVFLVRDATFRAFDAKTKRLRKNQRLHAVVVGRVWAAGTYKNEDGSESEVGFGHLGIFSMLVIQKVAKVW